MILEKGILFQAGICQYNNMETPREELLRKNIKRWVAFFMVGLVLSGLTAFPIESQLSIVVKNISWLPIFFKGLGKRSLYGGKRY